MKSLVLKMFLMIVLLYVGIAYYLYATQNQKLYPKYLVKIVEPKIAKKVYFVTSDGIKLEGAFTKNGENLPLVLYFGGNASNVIAFLDDVATKIKGFNFIGFNYPGYGASQGEPSEKKILQYALELFDKYKPQIVMGRSLGSAVASYVAAKKNPQGLLLITPIDSILHIAKKRYPFLPVAFLLKDKYLANEWIKEVKSKSAVILAQNEKVVPKESSSFVLKNLKNLVFQATIQNASHHDIYAHPQTEKILKEALKKVAP